MNEMILKDMNEKLMNEQEEVDEVDVDKRTIPITQIKCNICNSLKIELLGFIEKMSLLVRCSNCGMISEMEFSNNQLQGTKIETQKSYVG